MFARAGSGNGCGEYLGRMTTLTLDTGLLGIRDRRGYGTAGRLDRRFPTPDMPDRLLADFFAAVRGWLDESRDA